MIDIVAESGVVNEARGKSILGQQLLHFLLVVSQIESTEAGAELYKKKELIEALLIVAAKEILRDIRQYVPLK